MSQVDVQSILDQVEQLLAIAGELPEQAEQAVEKLLNVVEELCADRQTLAKEVERLRQQLDKKKKAKTTNDNDPQGDKQDDSNHSSEERRKPDRKARPLRDRRSSKDLTIHEERECPVDPSTLPPDAVRVEDESKVVQDIDIKPRNIRFERHVYYSAKLNKFYRGPLPSGYDEGDFSANLRALILSLKYCGNMSEPKIREFLENFDVQVSAGSVSNILTKTADAFADEFDDIVQAGLASTAYQQTDDTSARVAGQFWHTHILCNPFYAAYFTRERKDRLTVLEVLQNTKDLQFHLGAKTLALLQDEFNIPLKWQQTLQGLEEQDLNKEALGKLLDDWFGDGNRQVRTAIEQAAAIVFYRDQSSVPLIETIVCDDAGQFKLLTENLSLCWIHAGRHYEKLSPMVPRHAKKLDSFLDQYWDYYHQLQRYRDGPSEEWAALLRSEFDALFSCRTGYAALDNRIAKTAAKKNELLTVLSVPSVPLHNNASELQARVSARRRDVSLHSRSQRGARAMDIFTTIVQTSKLHGVSAYMYLRDRLCQSFTSPSLASIIKSASQAKAQLTC
jgi:regulator of replication initiation timing